MEKKEKEICMYINCFLLVFLDSLVNVKCIVVILVCLFSSVCEEWCVVLFLFVFYVCVFFVGVVIGISVCLWIYINRWMNEKDCLEFECNFMMMGRLNLLLEKTEFEFVWNGTYLGFVIDNKVLIKCVLSCCCICERFH